MVSQLGLLSTMIGWPKGSSIGASQCGLRLSWLFGLMMMGVYDVEVDKRNWREIDKGKWGKPSPRIQTQYKKYSERKNTTTQHQWEIRVQRSQFSSRS